MKTTISPILRAVTPLSSYLDRTQYVSYKLLTLWTESEDCLRLLKNPEFAAQFTVIGSEAECIQYLQGPRSGQKKPLLLVTPSRWKDFDGLLRKISRKKGRVFLLDQSTEAGYLPDWILVLDELGEPVDEIDPAFAFV